MCWWSTTHRVLKSHRSKMTKIYMLSWKVPALLGGHIVSMITYILCSSCFSEIWALCVSWITYDHLYYVVEHSLVHWYQQCVTIHHVLKCMSCYKAIVVKTGRAHCFHDKYILCFIYMCVCVCVRACVRACVRYITYILYMHTWSSN